MCLNGRHLYIYKSFLELNVKTCCFLQFSIQVFFTNIIVYTSSYSVPNIYCVVPIGLSHRNKYRTGWPVTKYPFLKWQWTFTFIVYFFTFLYHRQELCRTWLWVTRRVLYERETAYRSYVTDFLSVFGGVCVAHLFQFFELIVFVLCLVPNVACVFGSHHLLIYLFIGKKKRQMGHTDKCGIYLHPLNSWHVHQKTNETDKHGINTCFINSDLFIGIPEAPRSL